MDSIELGPFTLTEELGRGGAGVVFKALHRASGLPAAIKILRESAGEGERLSLLREIQVTAALNHPRIVRILDFGRVPAETDGAGAGVVVGEPWMALEFCNGGTLADRPPQSWPALRSVLVQCLDGLAHAHARGLLHGDIKPANVLRSMGSRGVKLSDLGIAGRFGAAPDGTGTVAGTPAYMAPEIWEGSWRDVGPPTDLYALACLTWRIVCGRTPYRGKSVYAQARAHQKLSPGLWTPTLPVPTELESWVRRLLSKHPAGRLRCAAEAARELLAISGEAVGSGEGRDPSEEPTAEPWTMTFNTTRPALKVAPMTRDDPARGLLRQPWDATPGWRPSRPPPQLQEASGLGSALLPVRAIPLVGREEERDALWAAWDRVRTGRCPGVVALTGIEGLGVGALARWLGERVLELGVGEVIRADGSGGVALGLIPALRAQLRCEGLVDAALAVRIRGIVDGIGPDVGQREAELLHGLVSLPLSGEESATRAVPPPMRQGMLLRGLELLARSRGLVIIVTGVADSLESRSFAEALLTAPGSPPVLLVLVGDRQPAPRSHLAELAVERNDAHHLQLRGLEPLALRNLGVGVFGLTPTLATRIGEHVAGNPGTYVRVVHELGRLGEFTTSAAGIGYEGALPATGGLGWSARLGVILRGIPPDAAAGLALAALLRDELPLSVWVEACARVGVGVPERWLERLTRARAAEIGRVGDRITLRVAHPAIREAILAGRADADLRRLHGGAADALAALLPTDEGRIGEHLLNAGRAEEAFEYLARATVEAAHTADPGRAHVLAQRLDVAADQAPPCARRDAQRALARARLAFANRQLEDAARLAEAARRMALEEGAASIAIQAAQGAGRAYGLMGRMDEAAALFERGEAEAVTLGDRALIGQLANDLGQLEAGRGRAEASELALRRALATAPVQTAWFATSCQIGHAQALKQLGRLDEATAAVEAALAWPNCRTDLRLHAAVLHVSGEIARARGHLAEAREAYEDWLALHASVGSPDARFAEINLVIVLLEQGEIDDAALLLERSEATLRRGQLQVLLGVVLILRLEVLAARGDLETLVEVLTEVEVMLSTSGSADPDLLESLRRTQGALEGAGAATTATRVEALAAEQARRIGR